jgi:hypothetical protein
MGATKESEASFIFKLKQCVVNTFVFIQATSTALQSASIDLNDFVFVNQ